MYDEALSLFERLAKQPAGAALQVRPGLLLHAAGRAEEAKKAREQANELSPAKK